MLMSPAECGSRASPSRLAENWTVSYLRLVRKRGYVAGADCPHAIPLNGQEKRAAKRIFRTGHVVVAKASAFAADDSAPPP